MPTYEYECSQCHVRFERRQRITDEPITTCPECGGATRRVLYPVGIIFKGSGFYCTDNRSNGEGAGRESTSKPSEAKEEKPAEKSAEKPETKASDKVTTGSASSAD